ncbi:SRPBCC domain-containing protein [Actinacidiphila sp. bgisy167]|uniref:SRPBCC domain-containing protein n=1 Tax=Actinacidiphila sp. bgisy167 TaxID=3413797 RepID=UPI003D71F034
MNDISITRVFDAPLAEVWKVWTEPELLRPVVRRPAADRLQRRAPRWRLARDHHQPHGEMPLSGVYQEVEAYKRLMWTMEVSGAPEVVMDATFTDHGDRGRLPPARRL